MAGIMQHGQATPSALLSLTSTGVDGDPFAAASATAFLLNTDNGNVAIADNVGDYLYAYTLPSTVVAQPHGPSVRIFNFTTFDLGYGNTLNVTGSLPAAFVASGDISIGGTINAGAFKLGNSIGTGAGGYPGGLGVEWSNGQPGAGPNGSGGGGGVGLVAHITSPCCGYNEAAGGGGGGSANTGQAGVAGSLFPSLAANGYGGAGGNPLFNPTILQGGGGGGAGAGGADCCSGVTGDPGAAGGGALLLETPGSITIGTTGVVEADGENGIQTCQEGGAGGGGGGGALWFDAGGSVVNQGLIAAVGGAAAHGPACYSNPPPYGSSGAGSGGAVLFDPVGIQNTGIIDVGDGNGDTTYGGLVYSFTVPITGDGQIVGQGTTLSAPEPATLALLGGAIGVLRLVRPRRRWPGARTALS